MNGLQLDWTVSIGQIFTALGFIASLIWMAGTFRGDVRLLRMGQTIQEEGLKKQEERLSGIETKLSQLTEVVTVSARLEERIIGIRSDMSGQAVRLTAIEADIRLMHKVSRRET